MKTPDTIRQNGRSQGDVSLRGSGACAHNKEENTRLKVARTGHHNNRQNRNSTAGKQPKMAAPSGQPPMSEPTQRKSKANNGRNNAAKWDDRLIDGRKEESFAGRLSCVEDEGDKAAFSIRQDWTDTGENAEWEEGKKGNPPALWKRGG